MDVVITPMSKAPVTRRAIKAAEKNNPNKDKRTSGFLRFPKLNNVSDAPGDPCPLAAIISCNVPGCKDKEMVINPDSFNPIIQINKPIPTVIANFKDAGITLIISRRIFVTVNIKKTRPDIKTAPSAVCQVNPIPITTVKE